jgi:hypothetical protein
MATFGQIPIAGIPGAETSGAIFYINRPTRKSFCQTLDSQWTVNVVAGESGLIVQGGRAGSYEETLIESLSIAQRALDLFSIWGVADLSIRECEREHIAWWKAASGVVVRLRENHDMAQWTFNGTANVSNSVGIPSPLSVPTNFPWHDSYRFFRLSQVTDDLYEAYRYLFLALESILSAVAPMQSLQRGKRRETEKEWLIMALQAVRAVDLRRYASTNAIDPASDLVKDFYEVNRTALFHAKTNRVVYLRHSNSKERSSVNASLVRLADLYLAIAGAYYGTRSRGRGTMTLAQNVHEEMARAFSRPALTAD